MVTYFSQADKAVGDSEAKTRQLVGKSTKFLWFVSMIKVGTL